MLVTLDSELQRQRKEGLQELARYYGGGQQVEIEETGQIVAPGVTRRATPIPRRRVRR